MIIPKDFNISKRSPSLKEIDALNHYLLTLRISNVLEFGCGITTYCLNESLQPHNLVCVEQFEPCITTVIKHVSRVQIVSTWDKIPPMIYDLVLVDSSTGAPEGLIPLNGIKPFRQDAIKYIQSLIHKNTIIVIHDNEHPQKSWRVHRDYLIANDFKCVWKYKDRYGFGAYVKDNHV